MLAIEASWLIPSSVTNRAYYELFHQIARPTESRCPSSDRLWYQDKPSRSGGYLQGCAYIIGQMRTGEIRCIEYIRSNRSVNPPSPVECSPLRNSPAIIYQPALNNDLNMESVRPPPFGYPVIPITAQGDISSK